MRKIADYLKKNFAGGTAAPAIELVYVFCKKMGIELDINMEAIAKINAHLLDIRKELSVFDMAKQLPKPFNPLTDRIPTEIDRFFNDAIDAARKDKEEDLLIFCRAIEDVGVQLPENEKELLLLELFPIMAHNFLLKKKLKQAHVTT